MKKSIIRRIVAFGLSLVMALPVFPLIASEAELISFSDVKPEQWHYEAVTYAAEKGIMVGTAEGIFSPDEAFNRAMTVMVLARLSGDDFSKYNETGFPDVPSGQWFTAAVAWAADNGIAEGDGTNFNPLNSVTRQELAKMVHNFAVKYEISNMFAAGPENTDGFNDAAKVQPWAQEGIAWAVLNGILAGVGNDMLDPEGTATRAQAAKIFYYLHYMKSEGVLPPDTADFDALTVKESDQVRFLCWGDSMTGNGYPNYLREISGVVTRNYGAGGDTAEHIAMKQGGVPFYVTPMTIPASDESIRVNIVDDKYQPVISLADLGVSGLSPVIVAGVKGRLYYKAEDDNYYFSRLDNKPYEEVELTRLTRIVTKGMSDQQTNDVHIIFSGPSNGYKSDEAYKLIDVQHKMIDYIGSDRYIIISLTSLYYMPGLPEFNADLAEEYGDHFLDFRSYVLERGLQDAGIEPTEQDLADLAIGEIPSSLRVDEEHGNGIFERLLAQQVYEKIIELGFIEAE